MSATLQKSILTEQDIIQAVCLKRQFQLAYQQATQTSALGTTNAASTMADLSSKEQREARRSQIKLASKIWQATSKFIRSQCNKGRVCETLLFGTFARADTVSTSAGFDSDYYVYTPSAKSVFKLLENRENLAVFGEVSDEKMIQLNLASVAQVCGASGSDQVQQQLQAIRDEIVESVYTKKATVQMNLGVGVLSINPNGSCQFKSNLSQNTGGDTLDLETLNKKDQQEHQDDQFDPKNKHNDFDRNSHLNAESLRSLGSGSNQKKKSHLSERDRQSIAERSIQYMQQRQQHDQFSRTTQNQTTSSVSYKSQIDRPKVQNVSSPAKAPQSAYFERRQTRNQMSHRTDQSSQPERSQTFDALNGFLRNQIEQNVRATTSTRKHRGSKSNRNQVAGVSHQIIDKVAERKARGDTEENVLDYVRSVSAHTGVPGGRKGHTLSRMKITANQSKQDRELERDYKDREQQLMVKTQNNYGHVNRELLTNALCKSPFNNTQKNHTQEDVLSNGFHPASADRNMEGQQTEENEATVQPTSPERYVSNMVQKALNRKTISTAYHTNVPVFLRSQGPFSIYDHSLRYLTQQKPQAANNLPSGITVTDHTMMLALKRHEQELQNLKCERETQKSTFYNNINYEQRFVKAQQNSHNYHMKQNQSVVVQQMNEARQKRDETLVVEKLYYKPHFGPEENEDVVKQMNDKEAFKKTFMNSELVAQREGEINDESNAKQHEKDLDKEHLRLIIQHQAEENRTMKQKDMVARQNLKNVWEEQMRHRQTFNENDNHFK